MKKLLSILLLSISLIGYSQGRVQYDELTDKGTEGSPTMYFKGALFNGVGYSVHSNGQLKEEGNHKDGKADGLFKIWYANGQLKLEVYYKDGKQVGLWKHWYENGQLSFEGSFKDGKKDGLAKRWYENGQLRDKVYWKDGQGQEI